MQNLIPLEQIERRIFLLRNEKVMLDRHLAEMYGVETRVLNQAVKRNVKRFPPEFMFQLTRKERDEVITICDDLKPLKFSRTMPLAFTEHGVAMLSSVLHSERAIQVNIEIITAFVRLRRMLATNAELKKKIEEMEAKYDEQFQLVFEAIRQFLVEEEKPKRKIGFKGNAWVVCSAAIHSSGDLAEFLPLLRFCEQTNIGKQTASGLGRIAVEATV